MVHNESQIAFKIFQGSIYLVKQIISELFRHITINLRYNTETLLNDKLSICVAYLLIRSFFLTLSNLGRIFSRLCIEIFFFLFFPENRTLL